MFIIGAILLIIGFVAFALAFIASRQVRAIVKDLDKYTSENEWDENVDPRLNRRYEEFRATKHNYNKKISETRSASRGLAIIGAVFVVVAIFPFLFFSSFYAQDVGEAKVLKDWTGNLVGQDLSEGADFKAPWVDTVDFDIRNQMAAYIGNGQDDYNGSKPNGPQITIQDKEGVSSDMDLVVIYSIKPDSVLDIYREYKNQDNFRTRLIEQDIRSVARNIPAQYNTLSLLNKRAEVGTQIQEALVTRWEKQGVLVESVSVQEIRPPAEVKERFASAQNARIQVETAKAEADAAREKAAGEKDAAITRAEGESEANNIIAKSLNETILQQRYLDTLSKLAAEGNLVVVPEGFNGLVNVR